MSWRATAWACKQRAGSVITKAVLMALARYADDKGYCWPAQETMARDIECSVDSVQRSLKKLERSFVRRIKRKSSDGRRISDAYQLLIDRGPDGVQSDSGGPAGCGPADAGHQAANTTSAAPQTYASPGGTLRPKSSEEIIQESSCRFLRETPGGARLEKKLGKELFNCWFAKVTFIGQRDHILILQAPTRLVAVKIAQWYDSEIVQCFQPEHKEAVRVQVIVPKNSAEGDAENSGGIGRGPAP